MNADAAYSALVRDVLTEGDLRSDRTGTGTLSLFGYQVRLDLQRGFPLLTTKRVHWPSVLGELLWFISGDTNANTLRERYGVTIWDEWAHPKTGALGPIYGAQWRGWKEYDQYERATVDQLAQVVEGIRRDPTGRRHIVSAWNVADLDAMALPPCHLLFQFYVRRGEFLDCQLYQRSADVGLGVPFNWASYAALVHMVARITNLRPGRFIWTGGDVHIYANHVGGITEQMQREPRGVPRLIIHGDQREIDDFKPEHFELVGYDPHASIKLPVAV